MWVLKTYRRRRREYSQMLTDRRDLKVFVLASPEAAERFLNEVKSQLSDTL